MAGFKETPRQKMIGMMYLVLTALLALNVSADILNAFTIVNEGMEQTNTNFKAKNDEQLSAFKKQYALNKAKVGKYYDKAKKAEEYSDDLIKQLEEVQNKVVGKTEFGDVSARNVTYEYKDDQGDKHEKTVVEPREVPLEWIENKSNYDSPMNVLLGVLKEDGTSGEATKLRKAFAKYKDDMKALLSEEELAGMKFGLITEDAYNSHAGKVQNWEMNTFYHTVLSADVVLLNKYIAEVMKLFGGYTPSVFY